MVMSPADRDELIRRVERKLGRSTVRPAVIHELVDRTLGALAVNAADQLSVAPATRPPVSPTVSPPALLTVVVTAASVPDLSSRLRRVLETHSIAMPAVASATVGRHTVVALRTPVANLDAIRTAAVSLGARCTTAGVSA